MVMGTIEKSAQLTISSQLEGSPVSSPIKGTQKLSQNPSKSEQKQIDEKNSGVMSYPRLISEKPNKLRHIDNIKGTDRVLLSNQNIRILTIQEVANLLRVHRTTVSRYAITGELKSYLIGNRRLFKEPDVWTFFENRVADEYVFGKEKAQWQLS